MLKLTEHESQLSELTSLLNVQGVDQAKISLIIQGLRDNYSEVHTTINDNTKTIQSNAELMEGLRSANMSLLSKLGSQIADIETRDKETFKNTKDKTPEQSQDEVKSLDDIATELMK